MENEKKKVEETLSAEPGEMVLSDTATSGGLSWTNTEQMKFQWKIATLMAKGNAIPDRFKNNPGDIIIAIDIASRSNQPLSMILNNMYSVYGSIGFSGQYAISAVNNSGKFTPLKFIETNNGGGGMIAVATRIADGELCKSEEITMELAKTEGWSTKNGSKWKSFPKQMMKYRAASFFVRAYCPELLYGYQTVEELQDIKGDEVADKNVVTINLESEDK